MILDVKNIKKTILLTGGTGFLGAALSKKLLQNGYKVIILKRSFSNSFRIDELQGDITTYDIDKVDLEKIFVENNSISVVVHCATDYGHTGSIYNVFETNLQFPVKLLSLSTKYDIPFFINTDTFLDKRISPYALSKTHLNEWMSSIVKDDCKIINVVVHHIYGPYDNEHKFIHKITKQLLDNALDIKLTNGKQQRDFIYIDDVVDAFLCIIEKLDNFELDDYSFEVGTNINTSLKDLVTTLKKISKNNFTHLDFGFLPYRDFEEMIPKVDTTNIVKLGWRPKVSLNQGLEIVVKTLNNRS